MPSLGELMRQRLVEQQRARTEPISEEQWLSQQMAAAQQQPQVNMQDSSSWETQTEAINQELAAQRTLKVDPEVDRIASIFFNNLIKRVNADFRCVNPDWEHLGAREKRHWLAATEALLDELRKEPVMKNELSVLAHRRIIAE